MKLSITEFNDNISFFISCVKDEDIYLTKRGIVIAIMTSKERYAQKELN